MTNIAIVGAGFSGTLVALHLLRRAPAFVTVTLIERSAQFARGQAYATGNPSHLLNVPAGRMSAFHDRPRDFIEWLERQHAAGAGDFCGPCPGTGTFVPRRDFGAYMRFLLNEEVRRPDNDPRLALVRGDVLDVELPTTGRPGGLRLLLDRGRAVEAELCVLALGNFPPEPPPVETPGFYDSARYKADPWQAESLAGLDPVDPVLLIGTGLTTIDAVVTLLDAGHTGRIHAVSRRGLLPHRHGGQPAGAAAPPDGVPTSVIALTRALRRETRGPDAPPWQATVDALRPFTTDLWQAMPLEDRRRFLRHLRPWWDIHRHRLAPSVGDRIDAARASGQLVVTAGRLRRFDEDGARVEVTLRRRGAADRVERLSVARVVNCAGPGADYDRIAHPLARALLGRGTVRPDRLRLGLDVTGNGALIDAGGRISRRLFAVGPVTKGQFWEMTAVPDIRRQCEVVAGQLASLVRPRA